MKFPGIVQFSRETAELREMAETVSCNVGENNTMPISERLQCKIFARNG